MTSNKPLDLDALEAVAEAGTPLPWTAKLFEECFDDRDNGWWVQGERNSGGAQFRGNRGVGKVNAEKFAAAVNAYPSLLALVRAVLERHECAKAICPMCYEDVATALRDAVAQLREATT